MPLSDWLRGTVMLGSLVTQEMGKITMRQKLKEEAPLWLEAWTAEAVVGLVERDISLWQQCLEPEMKDKALAALGEHGDKIMGMFDSPDEAVDLLMDVLKEVRSDLVAVMPRAYLQREIEAIIADAQARMAATQSEEE